MDKNKIIFLLLILTIVVIVTVSGQEKQGYIKPTASIGFSSYRSDIFNYNLATLALDVDFINIWGLTFGLQSVIAWSDKEILPLNNFGLGYTYSTNRFSIGGKIIAIPITISGGIGFNINGNYWFNKYIGLTGLFDSGFSLGTLGWEYYSIRIGVSTKI